VSAAKADTPELKKSFFPRVKGEITREWRCRAAAHTSLARHYLVESLQEGETMNSRNLTFEEATCLLCANRTVLVRVHPRAFADVGRHWARAFLIGAAPRTALVRPFGHKKVEAVAWDLVHFWEAGNAQRATKPALCIA